MAETDYELSLEVDSADELLCLASESEELARCTRLDLRIESAAPSNDEMLATFLDRERFPVLVDLGLCSRLLPRRAWSQVLTMPLHGLSVYFEDLFDRQAVELAASRAAQHLRKLHWLSDGVTSIEGFRALTRALHHNLDEFRFDAGITDEMIDEVVALPWPKLRKIELWLCHDTRELTDAGAHRLRAWADEHGIEHHPPERSIFPRRAARPLCEVLTATEAYVEAGDHEAPALRDLVERLLLDYDVERTRQVLVPWLDEYLPQTTIDAHNTSRWACYEPHPHPAHRFVDAVEIDHFPFTPQHDIPVDGRRRATSLTIDVGENDWHSLKYWPLADHYPQLQRLILPCRNSTMNSQRLAIVRSWPPPPTLLSIELDAGRLGYREFVDDGHRYGLYTFACLLEELTTLALKLRENALPHVTLVVEIHDRHVNRGDWEAFKDYNRSPRTLRGVPVQLRYR